MKSSIFNPGYEWLKLVMEAAKEAFPKPADPNGYLSTSFIRSALLRRYFLVAASENIPNTPGLTAEADFLEKTINDLKDKV